MIVGAAIRSGADIGARALARFAEAREQRCRISRGELNTQADQSSFPGKARQQIDDAVEVGCIDVEPYVERDSRKNRAVHALAKSVNRRPTFSAEIVDREAFTRRRHKELKRM